MYILCYGTKKINFAKKESYIIQKLNIFLSRIIKYHQKDKNKYHNKMKQKKKSQTKKQLNVFLTNIPIIMNNIIDNYLDSAIKTNFNYSDYISKETTIT